MKQNGRSRSTNGYTKSLLRAAGNPPTVEDAIRIVTSPLLQDVPLPPTNLETLKESLNIGSIRSEDLPLSGELRRSGKEFHILYSSHLTKERRRFTIAHEMGHAFFAKLGNQLPHAGSEVERLCDGFAAEILMPKEVFLEHVERGLTIELLFELRRIFEVSLSALAHRCFQLKRNSVFQIDGDTVEWGIGLVKKGPSHSVESGVRFGIEAASHHETGVVDVYFVDKGNVYPGELEWSRRFMQKTLFILRPTGKDLGVARF